VMAIDLQLDANPGNTDNANAAINAWVVSGEGMTAKTDSGIGKMEKEKSEIREMKQLVRAGREEVKWAQSMGVRTKERVD
jgi:hypothetical protein